MTTEIITLSNSNSTISGTNNVLSFTFPTPISFKNKKVTLSNLALYYSWRNVKTSYNNIKTFSYTWCDGTVVTVTLPDGFYSIDDISNYMQQIVMYQNKHYLLDNNSNPVYYLTFYPNTTYYRTTIDSTPVPTALPVGYSLPPGAGWALPALATTPLLTIPSGGLESLLGITAATYPAVAQDSVYSVNGANVPIISPVTSVSVNTNLVLNRLQNSQTIYTFAPQSSYGSYLSISPSIPVYYKVNEGQYTNIQVYFTDSSNNPLEIVDTSSIIVNLIITDLKE